MSKTERLGFPTLLALSVIALALVACGGSEEAPVDTGTEDTPTPTVPSATSSAASPTPTASGTASAASPTPTASGASSAASPTPTVSSTASAASPTPTPPDAGAVADLELTIDGDTSWQEVFDTLTATEQSCIRAELGDETERLLARSIFSGGPITDEEAALFTCLAPQTARALFLGITIGGMEEGGVEVGEEEWACLQGWVGGLDVVALFVSESMDREFEAVLPDYVHCLPALFLEFAIQGVGGVDSGDVREDELACLREWALGVDRRALVAGLLAEDPDVVSLFLVQTSRGLLDCAPRLLVSRIAEDLGEEVESDAVVVDCLRELLADPDVFEWIEDDSLDERLSACVLGPPPSPTE